jgi:hypothetical protein
MTNEAVLITNVSVPINFTCADGVGIEKGAILKLTDPNTVALADGTNQTVGGIAAEEKIASDGKTKIAVYRRGDIFRVIASGSITVGDSVGTALTNYVVSNRTTSTLSGSLSLGIALETAVDEDTFLMELNPTVINSTL